MRETTKGRLNRRPPSSFHLPSAAHGGGEIRTPVLHKIFRSVYARVPSIDVSGRWPTGRPRSDESAGVSAAGGERTLGLARICVT